MRIGLPSRARTRTRRPLTHGSRPVHVYDCLRTQICRGEMAPGHRIMEADVARALGVSRTPVRAALRVLLREGYVVAGRSPQQVRLRVAPLSQEDLVEVFQLIGALEGIAVRAAAALPAAARETLAAALRADTRALQAAFRARPPDYDERATLHRRFHVRLTDAAAGSRVRELLAGVRPQAERYEWIYGRALPRGIGPAAREHDAIANAILAADPDAAQRAVQANWLNAARRLSRVIPATDPTRRIP
jgi:DNA-binding GntR family transcriptional regulator